MSANTEQRKLAAIMFTDMVGYSALAQRDDKLALELLEEHRQLLREILPRFNGTEIKTIGDAFLIEFQSALEAAQCAIEIQRTLAKRNHDVTAERRIELKIGIHIGDVVHRGGDVYGDGVNIASRIEALAGAGGICVSMDVERQIRNTLEARFEKLAPTELKNISVAMDLFRIVLPWEQATSAPARPTTISQTKPGARAVAVGLILALALGALGWWMFQQRAPKQVANPQTNAPSPSLPAATGGADQKSIAVLPFVDMSEKKDQEYFADGLSEELIGMLTTVAELRVPARTSSFYFKGKQTTIADIAKALGVAHVLEGSVRKSGNTVRITAQLVRVDNGYHVWSETFDRQLDDIFKIQDEIAGAVVKSLKASLLEGEAPRTTPTTNTEAYTLYLQALSLSKRGNSADSLTAIEYLRQATRMDPQFALAWALSAQLHTDETVDWTQLFKPDYAAVRSDHDAVAYWPKIYAQSCTAGHHAGDKALTLAPKLAEAHMAMALVLLWCDWDWAAADAELRKARELDPGNAQATQAAADLAITLGRLDDAKQLARRAILQDPLGTAGLELARAAHRTGALDEAQAAYRKVIELYP